MIVLVCGGRDYSGPVDCLDQIPIDLLIHGGARGADIRAGKWAEAKGVHVAQVKALWEFYSKKAGSLRNASMLRLNPEYCVAFPGGVGTADMVRKCEAAGITVWKPYG